MNDETKDDLLRRHREKINEIDEELIALLQRRARVAKAIGEYKKEMGIPIRDWSREHEILKALAGRKVEPLHPEDLVKIYMEIMGACRHLEDLEETVGYLGPEGTFCEMAARKYFSEAGNVFLPFDSKWQLFRALEADNIVYGVTPVENSTQGTVTETLDLLLESSTIRIVGEIETKIHHNLIGHPGAGDEIEMISSHPQALAQTRKFIRENYPDARIKEALSTASAVREVKNTGPTHAAIGTELAAKHYGLTVLRRSIEDNPNNQTRFIIIGKQHMKPTGADKTSIIFTVKHVPGSLFKALKAFSDKNINLTKIESRPAKHLPETWQYNFYTDFEGHVKDATVEEALEEVARHTIFLKVLGSYPSARQGSDSQKEA